MKALAALVAAVGLCWCLQSCRPPVELPPVNTIEPWQQSPGIRPTGVGR